MRRGALCLWILLVPTAPCKAYGLRNAKVEETDANGRVERSIPYKWIRLEERSLNLTLGLQSLGSVSRGRESDFSCDVDKCGKIFDTVQALKKHKYNVHGLKGGGM